MIDICFWVCVICGILYLPYIIVNLVYCVFEYNVDKELLLSMLCIT